MKNDCIKKIDWGSGDEEAQIPSAHQKLTKISSSILVHRESRRNRSATGKMSMRAELLLLPFCLLLLKLEAVTDHGAPSCVYSSLTSFNLHSILTSIFAEFVALSYSNVQYYMANLELQLHYFD